MEKQFFKNTFNDINVNGEHKTLTDSKMELHRKLAPHQKPTQGSSNVHFAVILTTRNAEEERKMS